MPEVDSGRVGVGGGLMVGVGETWMSGTNISSGFVEEKRSPMASIANVRGSSPAVRCWTVRKKLRPRAMLRTVEGAGNEGAGRNLASLLPMDRS